MGIKEPQIRLCIAVFNELWKIMEIKTNLKVLSVLLGHSERHVNSINHLGENYFLKSYFVNDDLVVLVIIAVMVLFDLENLVWPQVLPCRSAGVAICIPLSTHKGFLNFLLIFSQPLTHLPFLFVRIVDLLSQEKVDKSLDRLLFIIIYVNLNLRWA